jgi:hydroxyacylglutathione hydrolase
LRVEPRVVVKSYSDSFFGTNSYLVYHSESKQGIIIDANFEPQKMERMIEQEHVNVQAIFLTHTHIDHIKGLKRLKEVTQALVYVHPAEADIVSGKTKAITVLTGIEYDPVEPDRLLEDGLEIRIGNLVFDVIHTPGHSPGGVTYRIDSILFTGDALFAGSIGRTDLPGGDYTTLIESITKKILVFPDDYIIYSGHGPITTVGQERRYNPFL